jgi:O-antigen/teichoic acid export membrane protein
VYDHNTQFSDDLQSAGQSRSAPAQITSRRLAAGTISSLFTRIFALSLGFFLTPLVIHSIGLEAYGLWAIVGSAVNYFALLDCGVGSSFVKYLAEFLERREHNQVRQVMTFGFLFYLAIGLVALPVVRVLSPHIIGYLRLDPGYSSAASDLLFMAVAYFVLSNALGIFGAFIIAMQRTEVAAYIDTCYQVIYAISLVLLLHLHHGVYALPYAIFSALCCTAIIRIGLVYRMFGNPWTNPFRLERHLVRRVFRFGFWMQLNALTALINLETDRIILGTFVSVISVGYYELGNKLAGLARLLPQTLLAPLLPAAAAFDGRQDGKRLNSVYVRGTRYLALTTFFLAGFLIGAGAQILQVWMGRSYPYVTIVMAALLVSVAINNLTGVGTTIVRATAQPYYETYYAVVGAIINIAATLILTPIFGLMGVVAGTVIGQVCGSFYFLWLFHRLRGLDWRSTLLAWLWRLTFGTVAASFMLWSACRLIPAAWFASRAEGVVTLALLGMAYLVVSFAFLWILGFWSSNDFDLVDELIPDLLAAQISRYRTARS